MKSKFLDLCNLILESIITESEGLTGRKNGDKFFNEIDENESHTFVSLEKNLTYDDVQQFLNTIPTEKLKIPNKSSKLIILSKADLANCNKNEKFYLITFHDNNLNEDWYIIKRSNNSDKIAASFMANHFNLRFEKGKSSSLKINAIDIFNGLNIDELTIDQIKDKFIDYINDFNLISDQCKQCAIEILNYVLYGNIKEQNEFLLSNTEAAIIKNTLSEIYDPIYYIKKYNLNDATISFNTSKNGRIV